MSGGCFFYAVLVGKGCAVHNALGYWRSSLNASKHLLRPRTPLWDLSSLLRVGSPRRQRRCTACRCRYAAAHCAAGAAAAAGPW